MLKNLGKIITLALLLGNSSLAYTKDQILKPFIARYASTWNLGLTITGEATRQLQQLENGQWQLSLDASALMAKLNEQSRLNIQNDQLQPLSYQYQRKVLNRSKQLSIEFDWQQGKATTTSGDSWSMPITPPLQDKLSVQLQLRKDLSRRPYGNFAYQVAAGGKIETFNYQVQGTEQLELAIGKYHTIKVARLRTLASNRETLVWFAPGLNYQAVRILQVEPDGKSYQLDLQSIE
ncbi:MAG: DUF3108 domain-containing protein [Gammaproteobacteria bacterium]|jgi:hypothetical protein|nr:DUF3108 domain-containing protein [Gammaproteobacteria bacterium]